MHHVSNLKTLVLALAICFSCFTAIAQQSSEAEKMQPQSRKVKIDEPVCAVNRGKLMKGPEGEYYYGLENKPEFPGGWDKYKSYLKGYFKNFSGTGTSKKSVTLSMIVERDGNLSNFKILRSQGDELDRMAIEALKHSGRWKPGLVNQTPVRSLFLIPVQF